MSVLALIVLAMMGVEVVFGCGLLASLSDLEKLSNCCNK